MSFIQARVLSEKTELGLVFVDWQECVLYPGQCLSHRAFLFPQSAERPHKLYLKVRWIPKSLQKDLKEKLPVEKPIKGLLKLLIMRGKGLGASPEISPYCELTLRSEGSVFKEATKPQGSTQNPEFLQYFTPKIVFAQDGPKPPLEVRVMNQKLGFDGEIGVALVDLQKALDSPLKWAIDCDFPVQDRKNNAVGEIYLQACFVPEGTQDPQVKPRDKDGKASLADDDMILGTLVIRVVHAKDLKAADGSTSDPYCEINFPDGTSLKSGTINKTVNPIWNDVIRKELKVPIEKRDQNIKFVVKDSDFLKDDMLGQTDVPWRGCIEKPGVWVVNELFKLTGTPDMMGKLSSLGHLYVQMQFVKKNESENAVAPPMIENLAEIMAQKAGIWKGSLLVYLVSAKGLLMMDKGSSDPMVVFKVAGGKQLSSDVIKGTLSPSWKKDYIVPVNMPRNVRIFGFLSENEGIFDANRPCRRCGWRCTIGTSWGTTSWAMRT